MKESILDVLLYLFEHYIANDADLARDRDSLQNNLLQAGFSPAEIHKAFEWLDGLAERRPGPSVPRADGPTRVYFGPELDKLDVECRGFLMFLEQQGILDADQRELVLDRAMALESLTKRCGGRILVSPECAASLDAKIVDKLEAPDNSGFEELFCLTD